MGASTIRFESVAVVRFATKFLIIGALALFAYGLVWNFSTRRYLKGFADAIIPLDGSPEEKTDALAVWFHHEPQRMDALLAGSGGPLNSRDPVYIVRNTRLLKICESSSNAFMNLAAASGLKVRRLLLLDKSGNVMHVAAEVQWGDRWVVVNPQQGLVFKDQRGRGLTKDQLRDPEVFRDAISRMPGYDSEYTFERTIHLRLARIPIFGKYLRTALDRFVPGWEEAMNWSYIAENPTLWLILVSIPLLFFAILSDLIVNRYDRKRRSVAPM